MAHPKKPDPAPTKRLAILDAARGLFLEHGYASTSVDAVVERAGVSKPTVYSYFPSKEALLDAVVRHESERTPDPQFGFPCDDPAGDLERLAKTLLTMALSPETLAWDRMMAGEARRRPELGRLFFDCGPARILTLLHGVFREHHRAGRLSIPDPELAADFFFGLLIGVPLLRGQLTDETLSPAAIAKRARKACRVFLVAYARVGPESV
jgi:TetR/AcrR family transcriptional regulator, mexJK operon transcriptional repressor